jgi:hypothetical protein
MLLPTKRLAPDRSVLGIGARVLHMLDEPKTVSRLWSEFKRDWNHSLKITYDWFVLALDLLYVIGAVDIERGRIRRLRIIEDSTETSLARSKVSE